MVESIGRNSGSLPCGHEMSDVWERQQAFIKSLINSGGIIHLGVSKVTLAISSGLLKHCELTVRSGA